MNDHIQEIADTIDQAEIVALHPDVPTPPSPPNRPDQMYGLPKDCPVIPLGLKGNVYYYMDLNRQLRILSPSDHSVNGVKTLFSGNLDYCKKNWPRWSQAKKDNPPEIIGTNWSSVVDSLYDACGRIGPVDIEKRVRGTGTWVGGDGALIMHCGDKVFSGDVVHKTGKIGAHVYPAAPPLPYPAKEPADTSAAYEVLEILKTWNWARPDIDPYLMLGWIGAAMIGGALDWRPLVWVTGDKATGKSTLQKFIKYIFDETALLSSVDASAAGIRQNVGNASLPVALDELEAQEDNRRGEDIIKLARFACSGGQSLRGGADHKGASFTLMNCFLFSSILIPPMLGQDVSRMAILNLNALPRGQTPPPLSPDHCRQLGRLFRRRFMDQWSLFSDTLELYKAALSKEGHGGRSADQFGTLLACADVLLSDYRPHSDTLDEWSEKLAYETLAEAEDDLADWERCIAHILTSQIQIGHARTRKLVADVIKDASKNDDDAKMALRRHGMAVHTDYSDHGRQKQYFRVANAHQGLRTIFENSHWIDRSGASGVWSQSLKRVPHAFPSDKGTSFAGSKVTRFINIPIEMVLETNQQQGEMYA